jgi:hypothetical protein
MTPSEAEQLVYHLQSAAKILKAHTPSTDLQDFESIELSARKHLLETVGPVMGEICFPPPIPKPRGKNDK